MIQIQDELQILEKKLIGALNDVRAMIRRLDNGEETPSIFCLLFELLFEKSPNVYLMQAEVYGWLSSRLPLYPKTKAACENRGWVDGRRNNTFWRAFWRWLASQEGVERVEIGKTARFVGITRKRWDSVPTALLERFKDM